VQEQKPLQDQGWIVTVFNNDYNTYEQVMTILMAATGCTAEEAYIEAWEIDNLGKSVVHHAGEEECRTAAKVIATIGIKVEVTQA
jgi:ATP-dependent Clp protease adaptor protein ClpS